MIIIFLVCEVAKNVIIGNDDLVILLYACLVTLSYFISTFVTVKNFQYDWLHPVVIFWGMLGLFIYNRFILHTLGLTDITVPNFMAFHTLKFSSIVITARMLFVFSICFCFSIFLLPSSGKSKVTWALRRNKFYLQCGMFFMLFGLLPAYYIQYQFYLEFLKGGYLSVFTHQISYNPPPFIKLPAMFFRLGFFLVLVSIPTKREFKIAFVLFFPFIILNLMTGIRGYYFSFILTILFYYYSIISPKGVNIRRIILIGLSIILLADFFASYRLGLSPFSTGFLVFYSFIYDQGTSILAVIHAVDLKSSGLLSGDIINLFDVVLTPDFMLQDKVDFLISPDAKSKGFSFGGSLFQEAYVIGGLGFVGLIGFCIPMFLNAIMYLASSNRAILALLLMVLPNIIFSPRSRLLDFIFKNTDYFIVFAFLLFILYILRRRIESFIYSS